MLARLTILLILASPHCVAETATADPQPLVIVPALTPVLVRVGEQISSNKNKAGDKFPIFVAQDVRVGDVVVIPAGSEGEGEVVHAAKSGIGGKAGELILAARFVRVGDREVRLRSFGVAGAGTDRTDESLGVAIMLGAVGLLVHGGARLFPRDGVAGAKTAEEVQLPAREASPTPAESIPVDTTKKGREGDESKTS
jgi:hypothetical protein